MILIISILISFLATLLIMPSWIKKAKKIGLIWEDMNKHKHPRNVVGSGGIVVLLGFVLGVLSYIAIKTFILETDITTVQIFALLTTVIIAGIIGLIDDFLGWAHGGLSAKFRIFLVFIAAVPLIVINAGESQISIPFLGLVNLGLIYPLIIIPLGIVGATTTYNFLAGYNSLEASQGVILLTSLALVTWLIGDTWISLILLMMVASLLAFLIFNKYPAKIFPGDALTYSVGALIAVVAILSNIERIVVFFFIPYIIETGLKLRGKYESSKVYN